MQLLYCVRCGHKSNRSLTLETGRVHTTVVAFVDVLEAVVKHLLKGLRGATAQTRRAKLQCDFSCLASIAGNMKVRRCPQITLHTTGTGARERDPWQVSTPC